MATSINSQQMPGPRASGVYGVGLNPYSEMGFEQSPVVMLSLLSAISASGSVASVAGPREESTLYFRMTDGRIGSIGANGVGQCAQSGIADPKPFGWMKYAITTSATPDDILTSGVFVCGGMGHVLVLTSSSGLYGAGYNAQYQLGLGDTTNRSWLVPCKTDAMVAGVAAGNNHSLAIDISGIVYGAGRNAEYQLGSGLAAPMQTWTDVGIRGTGVAASDQNSYILTSSGLYAAGAGSVGQLGDGSYSVKQGFVAVSGLAGISITKVVGGYQYVMCLTSSGTVYSWGWGDNGRTGHGDTDNRNVPTLIGSLSNIIDIAAGYANGHALDAAGHIYSWGQGDWSQGGWGDTNPRYSPVLTISGYRFDRLNTGSPYYDFLAVTDSSYDRSPSCYICGSPPIYPLSGVSDTYICGSGTSTLYPLFVTDYYESIQPGYIVVEFSGPVSTSDGQPVSASGWYGTNVRSQVMHFPTGFIDNNKVVFSGITTTDGGSGYLRVGFTGTDSNLRDASGLYIMPFERISPSSIDIRFVDYETVEVDFDRPIAPIDVTFPPTIIDITFYAVSRFWLASRVWTVGEHTIRTTLTKLGTTPDPRNYLEYDSVGGGPLLKGADGMFVGRQLVDVGQILAQITSAVYTSNPQSLEVRCSRELLFNPSLTLAEWGNVTVYDQSDAEYYRCEPQSYVIASGHSVYMDLFPVDYGTPPPRFDYANSTTELLDHYGFPVLGVSGFLIGVPFELGITAYIAGSVGLLDDITDLYIAGHTTSSSGCTASIRGHGALSDNAPLYMYGDETNGISGTVSCRIYGLGTCDAYCTLYVNGGDRMVASGFVHGYNYQLDSYIMMHIHGVPSGTVSSFTAASCDLYISNDGSINSESGMRWGVVAGSSGTWTTDQSYPALGFVCGGGMLDRWLQLHMHGHVGDSPHGIEYAHDLACFVKGAGSPYSDGYTPISNIGVGYVRADLVSQSVSGSVTINIFGIIDNVVGECDMFTRGLGITNSSIGLFVGGILGTQWVAIDMILLSIASGIMMDDTLLYVHGY